MVRIRYTQSRWNDVRATYFGLQGYNNYRRRKNVELFNKKEKQDMGMDTHTRGSVILL